MDTGWVVFAVLAILVILVVAVRTRLLAMFGYELSRIEPQRSSQDELRGAVDDFRRDGQVVREDRDRVGGLFDLEELEVSDVMVHRTNMRSVNADNAPEAVVREILQSPHTRMPLWKGSLDNIVGVLHAKDLLRALNEVGNDFSRIDVMKIASKPWFVPDTTTLQEQLNAFLRRKTHFAVVVDEYGEVEGLVTLEDIIEEIVGEIATSTMSTSRASSRRRTAPSSSKARCRSATSTGRSTGTCRTKRRRPSPASSSTRRNRSPRRSRLLPSTASASSS